MDMHLRPALAGALLAALLITACTKAPRGGQAEVAPAKQPQVAPASAGGPLTPAPGAVQMRTVSTGQAVDPATPGLYLFELASGKTEIWTRPGNSEAAQAGFATSDDGKYVVVRTPDEGFVVPRGTAEPLRWDRTQFELTAVGPDGLLFEAVKPVSGDGAAWFRPGWGHGGQRSGTGQFHFLNHNFQEQIAFSIPSGAEEVDRPTLFAPDGKQLAIATHDKLYLIDLTSGTARALGEGLQAGMLTLTPDRSRFLAAPVLPTTEGVSPRLYDWNGKLLATLGRGDPSPDGAVVATTTWAGGFTPAVVISDAVTGAPNFRVLGADLCYGSAFRGNRWLRDGSAVLVGTRAGVQLVSAGGSVTQLAALKGEGWHEPYASPATAGVFADRVTARDGSERLRVVDSAGKPQAEFQFGKLPSGVEAAAAVPVWHPTGNFLQYSLYWRGGHDGPCADYTIPLAPKVQRAPFVEPLTVKVQQTGDCLNVREQASAQARALACVKDGSVLTIAPEGDGKAWGMGAQKWSDGHLWARVRTADGKTGWVTLEGGYLTWAD